MGPVHIFPVSLCAFVPLCLVLIASCAPKELPPTGTKNFFYSHYYFNDKSLRKNVIDLTAFFDKKSHLYDDFHVGSDKGVRMRNVWGSPFDFDVKGSEKTAAFNAWVWLSISMKDLASKYGVFPKNFYDNHYNYNVVPKSFLNNPGKHRKEDYFSFYYNPPLGALETFYWDKTNARFSLLLSQKRYFDATNDAIVLSFFAFYHQKKTLPCIDGQRKTTAGCIKVPCFPNQQPCESYEETVRKAYDCLASLIDDNGHLSCCMIDGKVYNEMYSRHGLVIASLVYAYKILGKELYAEKAKKLADYFIEHNYHKEGYFDNWISIGTDSEICTGLLEVYDITGDKKYLNICEQVAKYYDNPHAKITHNPQGHKDLRHDQHIYSTVDQAEFVILLKNLYAFTKNKKYLTMARGILKDLEMCYDPKWKLYSHMCTWNGKHDDHFFAVIQALIYIAML